jgi:hypothetical protein
MAALIALAAIGLFAAGIFAGVIAVVSIAIRREERNRTLASGPTDAMTWAGRGLNGVYVRAPGSAPAADTTTALALTGNGTSRMGQLPAAAGRRRPARHSITCPRAHRLLRRTP